VVQEEVWPGADLVSMLIYHLAHSITPMSLQINTQMLVYLRCHGTQSCWPTSPQIPQHPFPSPILFLLSFLLSFPLHLPVYSVRHQYMSAIFTLWRQHRNHTWNGLDRFLSSSCPFLGEKSDLLETSNRFLRHAERTQYNQHRKISHYNNQLWKILLIFRSPLIHCSALI